jgi:gamma-glutamyltranspeptidase / glutathione hydrolase
MNSRVRWHVLLTMACLGAAHADQIPSRKGASVAFGSKGMVASVHPLATEAGLNLLEQGGNAVDAAVAVALTLGVVDGQNSGIGGGCFMLIRRADGSTVALDGREKAPTAARADMFLRGGKAATELSQTGALASGVPGSLAAYEFALKHYGRKTLGQCILPAAKIAESGYILDHSHIRAYRSVGTELKQFPSTRSVFFKPDGTPYQEGDLFRQPDLAATYKSIAKQGVDWFYRGPFAAALDKWMRADGGVMTSKDLRDYRVVSREPISARYHGYQIISFPPPSSGGVHVIQILNILENFDLKAMTEPARLHVIAEAMKIAFADRAYWLGDPDFVRVPKGLVDKQYAAGLARKIDLQHTTPVPSHGLPPNWQTDSFPKHTTHFSVADAEGNWVACTATINTTFGSKVVVPGTGVVLNNQMDDFSIQPGVANYFGLVGAEANAVAPGKRPLSSMSPTIVLTNGEPILAVGAAGGPTIISQVVLALVNMLDLGMTPDAALAKPRIHHQWLPNELMVEDTLPDAVREALVQRGHKLKVLRTIGVSQLVARTPDGKGFVGAADPRAGGEAKGW